MPWNHHGSRGLRIGFVPDFRLRNYGSGFLTVPRFLRITAGGAVHSAGEGRSFSIPASSTRERIKKKGKVEVELTQTEVHLLKRIRKAFGPRRPSVRPS